MRNLITGLDDQGRSCIAEEYEIEGDPVGGYSGMKVAALFRVEQSPPPARPPALADTVDVQLPPGHIRWMIVEHAPRTTHEAPSEAATMHHTDTLDFIYVQEGSAEFLLQDGVHEVAAGDHIVTTGVDHAWRAGPDGARLLVVSIGTPKPS
jgi:quercetin dioxygenase-like cupin family protein